MTTGKPLEISVVFSDKAGCGTRNRQYDRTSGLFADVQQRKATSDRESLEQHEAHATICTRKICIYTHEVWHTSTPPALEEHRDASVYDVLLLDMQVKDSGSLSYCWQRYPIKGSTVDGPTKQPVSVIQRFSVFWCNRWCKTNEALTPFKN